MSMAKQSDWFLDLAERGQQGLAPVHLAWIDEKRRQARQQLTEMVRPHRKQEAWRYTNLDALLKTNLVPAANEGEQTADWQVQWLLDDKQSYRLLFSNGRLQPAFTNIELAGPGVVLNGLQAMLTRQPELVVSWFDQARASAQDTVFTALNTALLNDGAVLYIPKNICLDKPIEIIYAGIDEQDRAVASQLRNLIVLESGAQATLIERFIGNAKQAYLHNSVCEIVLEDGAQLAHYRVQDESAHGYHMAQVTVRQARDAQYRHTNFSLGAAVARTDLHVQFAGENAEAELDGLYVVGDQQQIDNHLAITHAVPRGTSRENYKGILLGRGRAVFDGRIVVAKDAQHTDAHLSNKNLLLSRDAEVDTKPQLEIYADDVKCSHGTTVGQIDPDQLYYLRARGIDPVQAQQMLCLGFAGEILDRIEIEPLRAHVGDRLTGLLTQTNKAMI